MARFPRLFGAAALTHLTLLAHCRPLTDGAAPMNSSASSWADWSSGPRATSSYASGSASPSPSSIPIPNPTINPYNGSCTSYNSTPAYTNTPETLDDMFTIEYFPDYDFSSNRPEPQDPSLPDPDGKLMDRMAEDEANLPAYLRFVNGTSSSSDGPLMTNVDDILQYAGMTSSNSAIAGALLSSLRGSSVTVTSPTSTSTTGNVTVSERDMTVFLESCLLDYDSCTFWDADTMEVVDATMAMAGTDLWETRDENQSVWPIIAQWVLELGVDILVGDRPITNDMVIPMRFAPGGVMSAASGPVMVPSVSSS